MRAIVTVIGKDQVGIIAAVCALLAEHNVNVLDISQTVLQEYFTMIMLVDASAIDVSFAELSKALETAGNERSLSIRIQSRQTDGVFIIQTHVRCFPRIKMVFLQQISSMSSAVAAGIRTWAPQSAQMMSTEL